MIKNTRKTFLRIASFVIAVGSITNVASADGPSDNSPAKVRAVPPVGIVLSQKDYDELKQRLTRLSDDIRRLKKSDDAKVHSLLPDVEIFARAVRDGLAHRELFSDRDVENAKRVVEEGLRRAAALSQMMPYWTTQTGLVVRGFRSRIDQTVQPYGLVIPDNYLFSGTDALRLDIWLHGRGERSSESVFIAQRMTDPGRYTPRDTIVLHPYGRYSNAFKFAGETDVFEAWEHVARHYRIDRDRVAIRGFSMGGAGCWQFAVHYPDLFFAANPGAGFSETPEFLKYFQKETLEPTWFERKLWQLYDCPGYAVNLRQLPTIAYSGELDIQKQAADLMEKALQQEGIRLMHVIGENTKHAIDERSRQIIERKMASLARGGRKHVPSSVRFATYTLKYSRCHWMQIVALKEHWRRAEVDAAIDIVENTIRIKTSNVRAIDIEFLAGQSPFPVDTTQITIQHQHDDGTSEYRLPGPFSDGSAYWQIGSRPNAEQRAKRPGLQGPIDDAFMDSFVVVRPTGDFDGRQIAAWTTREMDRFVKEWRRHFRGDAVVKADSAIDGADIANSNLILFGTPQSNRVLGRICDDLPIQWEGRQLSVGSKSFDAETHVPIMIYPNPLNSKKYVVLNSGFTFREFAYLNNARQVPKLPDWAIVDVTDPPNTLWPGRIVAADFFDENWNLKP